MERKTSGMASRGLRKAKNFFLMLLFLIIPFAGVFHPKIRRREGPDEKEIGDGL